MAGIGDIEALRQFRVMNLNSNWMKDLRTEIFRRMYEQPQHRPTDRAPELHTTPPARRLPGARFLAPSDDSGEVEWEAVKELWQERE